MSEFFLQALLEARKAWGSWHGPSILSFATLIVVFFFLPSVNLERFHPWHAAVGALFLAAIWTAWASQYRLRRPKKDHVGFGIAISVETDVHRAQLQADFIREVRRLLWSTGEKTPFDVIVFPEQIARNIVTPDHALQLLARSKCTCVIYGTAKKRTVGNAEAQILDLEGVVSHKPIPADQSKSLGEDFRAALPKTIRIEKDVEFLALPVTAQFLAICARYVVGISALLSDDLLHACRLLKEAQNGLEALDPIVAKSARNISVIKSKIPEFLAEALRRRTALAYDNYVKRRDRQSLEACEPLLDELEIYRPDDYSLHLQRAICAFVLRRDFATAHAEIDKCRHNRDAAWRYSKGFLLAYQGDLDGAWKYYRQAFHYPSHENNIPIHVEEFIQLILEQEPDKAQLYYVLGLINKMAKRDVYAARKDFEVFLEVTSDGSFDRQRILARKWLGEIAKEPVA